MILLKAAAAPERNLLCISTPGLSVRSPVLGDAPGHRKGVINASANEQVRLPGHAPRILAASRCRRRHGGFGADGGGAACIARAGAEQDPEDPAMEPFHTAIRQV